MSELDEAQPRTIPPLPHITVPSDKPSKQPPSTPSPQRPEMVGEIYCPYSCDCADVKRLFWALKWHNAPQTCTFPDNSFDYIHIRYMIGCFKDWNSTYRESYRCRKPGGWLEHMECSSGVLSDDGSIPSNKVFSQRKEIFHAASKRMGQTFEVIDNDNYIVWMEEAGFRNIQSQIFKTPVGPWPAD
ncbi:hypothetical protein B0H67DRAFT_676427 [Lasiosphaeris hirsuta]|uniref:Uncharacterized protein n=1 Tax=Lasiosphaeris hirsuta TaxID=260670 RepID=A0AA40DG65_9PEZI|nr:hypothetical protein B0H67DRAFT_676427 [Lasiosphaeris hirsuta]